MHVAEAPQVHDNIEAQALPGSEGTQHFIVASAMPKAEVNDLAPARLLQRFDFPPQLTIWIQALLVEQRCRQAGALRRKDSKASARSASRACVRSRSGQAKCWWQAAGGNATHRKRERAACAHTARSSSRPAWERPRPSNGRPVQKCRRIR